MKITITRSVTGLAIIAAGAALLFSNLGIYNFNALVNDWWPVAIIVTGLLILLNDVKSYVWALLIIVVGSILQLKQLDIVDINPWQLLTPLLIIFIGISVLLNRSATKKSVTKSERDDITAILSGSNKRNTSEDFRGSKITAIMGGVKIDLRKATIKKEATLELVNFWGGIEIIVPRNIVIRNQTSAIMGGVEDKTEQDIVKNAPVLYITGDVIMAGVEIKN